MLRRGEFTIVSTLAFSQVEGIINDNLPFGALRSEQWWNNDEKTAQGYAWTSAGWRVQSVDLEGRTVTFKQVLKEGATQMSGRKRKRAKKAQKPFKPVPVKPRRMRKPSKTRIAKALARARNVERKRAAAPPKLKLKPKRAYEKKLYKPDARPTSQD